MRSAYTGYDFPRCKSHIDKENEYSQNTRIILWPFTFTL